MIRKHQPKKNASIKYASVDLRDMKLSGNEDFCSCSTRVPASCHGTGTVHVHCRDVLYKHFTLTCGRE